MTAEDKVALANIISLLVETADIRRNQKILLVNEKNTVSVDTETVSQIAKIATSLGADVSELWLEKIIQPECIPEKLIKLANSSDAVIFNHSVGAMLRLRPDIIKSHSVLNYLSNKRSIRTNLGDINNSVWNRISRDIDRIIKNGREWSIRDSNGTNLSGNFITTGLPKNNQLSSSGFVLHTFPMGTHTPLKISNAKGHIAIKWLASSANHDIGEGMLLENVILAKVQNSKIVAFDGDPTCIQKLNQFLTKIGDEYDKDPYLINSWHAGTHPFIQVPWSPTNNLNAWQLLSHNSSRLLHFHVVGESMPGEISIPILDPVVSIDGENFWTEGKLTLLESPEFHLYKDSLPMPLSYLASYKIDVRKLGI